MKYEIGGYINLSSAALASLRVALDNKCGINVYESSTIIGHTSRSGVTSNPLALLLINKDAVYNMRGKYEFTFLIYYLSSLDKMVNDPSTAFEDHAMKFNMGQKDALSALAQYAERDCDLEDYIKRRSA